MTGVVVDKVEQIASLVGRQTEQLIAYQECIRKINDYLESSADFGDEIDEIHITSYIDKLNGTLRAIGA